MKTSKHLIWLASLAGLLALIAASAGLFWPANGSSFPFTTLRGQEVQIFGRGIYRYDSQTSAATYLGTDAVTILLMVPLLVVSLLQTSRGSLRGGLLLVSMLGCILYNSFHMAFAAAYNPLFLLYVAFFSASLFAFLMAFNAIPLDGLPARISTQAPRRGPAIFLIIAGAALALVWLSDLLPALMKGQPPLALGSSTTMVTYAIELSVIVPATLLAGILLLRRAPLGYLLGAIFLVINAVVGIVVVAQTIAQVLLGGSLTPAVVTAFVAPFILLAVCAGWFLMGMLRGIEGERCA